MTSERAIVMYIIYRCVGLLLGFVLIYWGRKDSNRRKQRQVKNTEIIEGGWEKLRIVLKNITSPTYLILLGTIIIGITIFKGIDLYNKVRKVPVQNEVLENFTISSNDTVTNTQVIDTIFRKNKLRIKQRKYFEALNTCYFIKGFLIAKNEKKGMWMENEMNIEFLLSSLKKKEGNNNPVEYEYQEKTESVHINDEIIDSTKK